MRFRNVQGATENCTHLPPKGGASIQPTTTVGIKDAEKGGHPSARRTKENKENTDMSQSQKRGGGKQKGGGRRPDAPEGQPDDEPVRPKES